MASSLQTLLACLYCVYLTYSLKFTSLSFDDDSTRVSTQITFKFTADRDIQRNEIIQLNLPYLTRRIPTNDGKSADSDYDLSYGQLLISPSTLFTAQYKEGTTMPKTIYNTTIYQPSSIYLKVKSTATTLSNTNQIYSGILENTDITIIVYRINGIGIWCGFPPSTLYYQSSMIIRSIIQLHPFQYIIFNATNNIYNGNFPIETYDGVGTGCNEWNECNGHGVCDYCKQQCICNEGYGASTDNAKNIKADCSERVCPLGQVVSTDSSSSSSESSTTTTTTSTVLLECSGRGDCDRNSGTCLCTPPFTGPACQRFQCPNDCSGRGKCVSMNEVDITIPINSKSSYTLLSSSSSSSALTSSSSTEELIYVCVCDSEWSVGFGSNQVQLSHYFGPDCSLKHCPSGDDPYTTSNEEDCYHINQMTPNLPHRKVGERGNKCHIDCSNRGICDYTTGKCTCFKGSWGENCAKTTPA